MDTKIVMDVICVHCGIKIQLQKKKQQGQCKLVCPNPKCRHNLHILFDTSKDPQTYSFLSTPQSDTSNQFSSSDKENTHSSEQPKKDKKKTIYKKDKKVAHSYEDEIPGEEDIPDSKKKHPVLRESLFLTRKKFMGLIAERYQLKEGRTVIGREDEEEPSDISLSGDDTISRRSIEINIVADEYGFDYILKVLNASNPVKVNGKEIRIGEKKYLDVGDMITIGHTNLRFDNR